MLLSILRISLPVSIIAGCLMFTSTTSLAKPDYTKKEKKGCTYCHTAANKKDLNDMGKCYAEHDHSLADCPPKS